jgi:tRNA A-37 threonylcarbamoyl transferase component Bud32
MSEYRKLTSDGWTWRVAAAWAPSFTNGPFARFDELLRAGRPVKDLNIKRTIEVRVGGASFLVKIYKRRGALQQLRSAILGSRAGRELDALLGAVKRGVPTLPFVAVGERKGESCVVIRREPDRVRLDHLLESSPRRRALIEEYGRWARRVHDAGVAQYDFNPTNVLASSGDDADLRLIDYEKVTVGSPPDETARLKSLAKIWRMIPATNAFCSCFFPCGFLFCCFFGGSFFLRNFCASFSCFR